MAVKLNFHSMFLTVIKLTYLYCLFALLMLNLCLALYEDQVGLFDWRQQYIGNAKEVYFEQSTHSKRVFATTEENVLAALNARTGNIMWRKVFERKDGVIGSLLHSSNVLVTVSSECKTVRSWDPNKGHLLWESISQHNYNAILDGQHRIARGIMKGRDSILLEEEVGGIVLASSKVIRMISHSDGSDIWEYFISDSTSVVLGITKSDDRIILFCMQELNGEIVLTVKHLDIETGKLVNEVTIHAPWLTEKNTHCVLVSNRYLVCLIQSDLTIAINHYANGSNLFKNTDLKSLLDLKEDVSGFLGALSTNSDAFFIRLDQSNLILAKIDKSHNVDILRQLHASGFYAEVILSKQKYIFEVYKDTSSDDSEYLHTNVYKYHDDSLIPMHQLETHIPFDSNAGMGVPVFGTVYAYSKRNDINYRILVSFEEYSLSLIQNMGNNIGKILWVRNEALSGVMHAKMIELPPSTSASKLELLHAEFSITPNII